MLVFDRYFSDSLLDAQERGELSDTSWLFRSYFAADPHITSAIDAACGRALYDVARTGPAPQPRQVDAGRAPTVHVFASTAQAYDASQSDDAIGDGDVLIVPTEQVVGFLYQGVADRGHPPTWGVPRR